MTKQYTGLKDKNGVKIYKGDIMGWAREEETLKSGIIIFENGKYVVQGLHSDNDRFKIDKKRDEVIGNIYENPELLTNN